MNIPNTALDGFLLSPHERDSLLLFADLLEETGQLGAADVREAIGWVVERRGPGWFVGFLFPKPDEGSPRYRPGLEAIAAALAQRAVALGDRVEARRDAQAGALHVQGSWRMVL